MKTKEIIKNKLEFLITDYDFDFDYNSNGKEVWCKFTNKYGSINWYSYEQFGEYELSIVENGKGKKILDSFRFNAPPFKNSIRKTLFWHSFKRSKNYLLGSDFNCV